MRNIKYYLEFLFILSLPVGALYVLVIFASKSQGWAEEFAKHVLGM